MCVHVCFDVVYKRCNFAQENWNIFSIIKLVVGAIPYKHTYILQTHEWQMTFVKTIHISTHLVFRPFGFLELKFTVTK